MAPRGRGMTVAFGMQELIQLILALGSAAGAVILIGQAPTFRVLIIIAALAGVTGSLLTPYPGRARSRGHRLDLTFPLLYGLIGLGAGGGGFLVSSSLLVGRVVTGRFSDLISPSGTAAFGLLVGLASGRAARFVAVTVDNASIKAGTLGTLGAAIGYIDNSIQERLFGPTLVNFDGVITAEWHPTQALLTAEHWTRGQPVTMGRVRVQISGGLTEAQPIADLSADSRMATPASAELGLPAATAHGRLHIDGGESASEALFTITLRNYLGEVFPSRTDIVAPARGLSEVSEFTFLRVPRVDALLGTKRPIGELSSALIDISQSGTTVQLLEIALSPPSGSQSGERDTST